MIEIALRIIAYWLVSGAVMSVIMIAALCFAHVCEYIVDFFFKK